DVGVVERSVHLVEQAEGARLREEDAEQQRERDEGALAAREQVNALRLLAAWRRMDLDVAIQRSVGIFEAEIALSTAEQRHEDLSDGDANLLERREEELSRRRVDLLDRLEQGRPRVGQIGALRDEEVVALRRLVLLLDRQRVHRPELLELTPELRGFRTERIVVEIDRR